MGACVLKFSKTLTESGRASYYSMRDRLNGKAEGEDRSMPHVAGDFDGSTMGFHNRLRDCKAHPCPGDSVPLAFASVKLRKYLIDFSFLYSRPHIRYMENDKTAIFLGVDRDRFFG